MEKVCCVWKEAFNLRVASSRGSPLKSTPAFLFSKTTNLVTQFSFRFILNPVDLNETIYRRNCFQDNKILFHILSTCRFFYFDIFFSHSKKIDERKSRLVCGGRILRSEILIQSLWLRVMKCVKSLARNKIRYLIFYYFFIYEWLIAIASQVEIQLLRSEKGGMEPI